MNKFLLLCFFLFSNSLFSAEYDVMKRWPLGDNWDVFRTKASKEEPAYHELLPKGVTPRQEHRAIAMEMASKVYKAAFGYDQSGEVIWIHLSNHSATIRGIKDESIKSQLEGRTGIDSQSFSKIAEFKNLKGLILLHQPLADSSFEVLKQWPDLEVFWIENHKQRNRPEIAKNQGATFMPYLNSNPKLRILGLKHLFGLKQETMVDQLGAFPNLKKVELDMGSASNKCLPFLKKNPQILDIELHRSNMNNDEVQQVIQALPNVKRFVIKPYYSLTFDASFMENLKQLKSVEVIGFHHWKKELIDWEKGLSHLSDIPTLKQIEGLSKFKNELAVKKLLEKRPALKI